MSTAPRGRSVAREALVFWAIAALVVAVLSVLREAAQPLLLAFAGILFGTALRGSAEWTSEKLRWPLHWSLAACLLFLLTLIVGAGFWIAPNIADQMTTLADRLRQSYDAIRQAISHSPLGSRLLDAFGTLDNQLGRAAARAAGILASTAGSVGAVLFVFFVAVYVAAAPETYRRGILSLVPPARRRRAGEILDALASTLRRWLLGRIVSMTAVGLATSLGLWIIGVPLPVTLGLIAGVLGFVPNIGPIVSALPAVLLAFTVSPLQALYVLALYLAINLGDGYGLTPWIQTKAIALPPALIITGQVVTGAVWGVLGVTLATPMLACLVVMTRELYVRDVLERAASPASGPGSS